MAQNATKHYKDNG